MRKLRRCLTIASLREATYKDYFFGRNLHVTARIWRHLPGNFGYVHLGGLQDSQQARVLHAFRNTKGFILDLRAYPQSQLGLLLASLPPPVAPRSGLGLGSPARGSVAWSHSTVPALSYPGYLQGAPPALLAAAPRMSAPYAGNVVVLVNEKTQSYGETVAMLLQTVPGLVIIGSQTAGANGNIVQVVLPGGVETYYSGSGMYYPDGRETQRVGIVPTLTVTPTVAGLRAGHDEVLDRALTYLSSQP